MVIKHTDAAAAASRMNYKTMLRYSWFLMFCFTCSSQVRVSVLKEDSDQEASLSEDVQLIQV